MKSIGTIQMIIVGLVSLTMSLITPVIAGPAAPDLIGFDRPYEITICESEWPTFELNIDARAGLNYRWDKSTDQAVLDALEFSPDNTRVRFQDATALPQNVSVFLVVQAVDATGCESPPTVITLILVPQLALIPQMLDTACVGRPQPISPVNLIEPAIQNRVDSLIWDFNGVATETGGNPADLEDFIITFDSEGTHDITMNVVDNRGCISSQTLTYDVFSAAPFPDILMCEYLGPDSILFEWSIDENFIYDVEIFEPTGATVLETDTSVLITNIISPLTSTSTITVTSEGNSPEPCNITSQTALCRACLPVNFNFDNVQQLSFCAGDDGLFPVPLTVDVITNSAVTTDPPQGGWVLDPGVELIGGQVFFNPAGLAPGRYTVDYDYVHPIDACPHTGFLTFTIFDQARPNASLSETSEEKSTEICSEETVTIFFDTFDGIPRPNISSNDQSGELEMERDSKNSVLISFGNFEEDYEIYIDYALPGCIPRNDTIFVQVNTKPVINIECGVEQADAIEIFWNSIFGTSSYEVFLDGVSQGLYSDTTTTISNLLVNEEYILTVEPVALGCSSSASITCSTGGCLAPDVDLSNLDDPFCYNPADGPINLDVELVSNITGMPVTYQWDTPDVDSDNNFFPSPAQEVYTFDIVYTEGACTDVIQAVSFTAITAPEPTINLIDSFCLINGSIELTTDLQVFDPLGDISYESNFPMGINPTSTGLGVYLLSLSDGDTYDIGVTATYKGCTGPEVITSIFVDEPLPAPALQCGAPEMNEIEIFWNTIIGGDSYEVFLDGVTQGISTDTSMVIPNLVSDTNYEITVEHVGRLCPSSSTITCSTGGCVSPIVDLSSFMDTICYNPANGLINLDLDITSGIPGNAGTYAWDTPLIDADNNFEPDPTQEVYTFDVVYTEGSCSETIRDISFTVLTAPEPTLNLMDSLCISDGSVNLTTDLVVADPLGEITYQTNFPTGVTATEIGNGEWQLDFDGPDIYEIGITTTYKGCQGPEVLTTIEVGQTIDPPVLSCEEIIGAVVLTWEAPTFCVSSWEVLLGTESQGFTSSLRDTIILEEIRQHDLTVVALSNNCICGDAAASIACSPLPCPTIDIMTERIDTCFNPTLAPFDFPVTVVESPQLPVGSGQWSGQLIDNNGQVDISKTNFGDLFTLEYSYTQGTCRTTVSEEINLAEPPTILNVDALPPACPEDSLGTVIVLVEGGTPDYSYSVNGGPAQADNIITGVPVGFVTIEVTDALGCVRDDIEEITEAVVPNLDLVGPDVVVQNNDADFTLNTDILPADIVNISWFLDGTLLDEGSDLFSITVPGIQSAGMVEVVVDFGMGCTEMRAKPFEVNIVQSIYIPNVVDYSGFSSSVNSEWKAFINGDEAFILSVQIYDRWGNLIKDYENGNKDSITEFLLWDGFFGSEPADQGVYTYVIATEISGRTKIERGSITILR